MSCCSLACMCHSFHYIKRILETMFVHRISHGTMPLRNIFKVSELHNYDLWTLIYSFLFLFVFLVSEIWTKSMWSPILTYYSPCFYSRTVAITGALQLGWRTTLTTLSIPHPVSADHCDSHCNSWVEACFHLNPFFCGTSTDYGQQQVKTGLYIFVVRLKSVWVVYYWLSKGI